MKRPADCAMSMMTFSTPTPETCGIVKTDKSGRVTKMFEKIESPPGNLANGGIYIFEQEVIDWIVDNPDVTDISTQVILIFSVGYLHGKMMVFIET